MVRIAETDRRIRETEEAGTRQAEETLRKREDVLYNQIMRVHQGTVDTYLDWIIKNTLELGRLSHIFNQPPQDKPQL